MVVYSSTQFEHVHTQKLHILAKLYVAYKHADASIILSDDTRPLHDLKADSLKEK